MTSKKETPNFESNNRLEDDLAFILIGGPTIQTAQAAFNSKSKGTPRLVEKFVRKFSKFCM